MLLSCVRPIKFQKLKVPHFVFSGFFADISGEVDSRPHLPWRFWGSAKCLGKENMLASSFCMSSVARFMTPFVNLNGFLRFSWNLFSTSCLSTDPEDCGYDVFDGVPTDPPCEGEGDNDFLFEVSDSPHLPTFRLLLPAASTKA